MEKVIADQWMFHTPVFVLIYAGRAPWERPHASSHEVVAHGKCEPRAVRSSMAQPIRAIAQMSSAMAAMGGTSHHRHAPLAKINPYPTPR